MGPKVMTSDRRPFEAQVSTIYLHGPFLSISFRGSWVPLKGFQLPFGLLQGRSRVDMIIGAIRLFLEIGASFYRKL